MCNYTRPLPLLIKQGFENKLTDKRCSKSCPKLRQKIVSPPRCPHPRCVVWNSWRNDVKVKRWRGILWSSQVRGRVGTCLLYYIYQFLIACLSVTKKSSTRTKKSFYSWNETSIYTTGCPQSSPSLTRFNDGGWRDWPERAFVQGLLKPSVTADHIVRISL